MSYWVWGIILVVVVGMISGLQQHYITQPGRAMARKFADLGQLAGKTKTEIIWAVGNPTSFSAMADGKSLLQWQETGYHIALLFSGEKCDGVTHEHLARN